jgi:hypothetical protein
MDESAAWLAEKWVTVERLEGRMLLSVATFAAPVHYRFNTTPRDSVIADFNGDGSPDIAAVIPSDGDVGILLNNGDGTFTKQKLIHDGNPRAVAAGDFDHNGTVDLAVMGGETSGTGGTVEIFSGNGNGTFSKVIARYHLAGAGPVISAVDLNNDGFLDLVFATEQRVAVLMNNGDGTFAPAVYYASGGDHPTGMVVGDFNGDGLPDVAVSRGREHDVSVLLNNPSAPGTFGLPNFFPTAGNVSSITMGDFNHDGIIDFAVTNSDFEQVAVGVMIGNGNGTFRPIALYGGSNFSDAVIAGDFSGTGNDDLVVGSFSGELKLYPGNGDGTFGTPETITGGLYTQYLKAADFNADGKLDLMTTPYTGLRVLMNTTGTVPPAPGNGLDKTLGAGNPKSFTFYTPEGTQTTVSLNGPGSARLHFSASGAVNLPNGGTVNSLTLADIATTSTTSASSLAINVHNESGSQTVNLDSIVCDSAIGSISGGRVNVTGNVTLPGGANQIKLLSANSGTISIGAGKATNIQVQQIGGETIDSAVGLGQINVRLDAHFALTAPSLAGLNVGGNLLDSTINLSGPFAAGAADLKNATISKDVLRSTIAAAGNVGTFDARTMVDCVLQAGVAGGVGLPASDADFVATASIDRVNLQTDSRRVSFGNSVIAASQVGPLVLGRVQTENGGTPFGVAGRSIRSVQGTDISTGKSFKISNPSSTQAAAAALSTKGIDPHDLTIAIV